MNKADLVNEVTEVLGSKQVAQKAVDCIFQTIQKAMERDERVSLVGFGSFTAEKRAARTGRNPRTGDPINIPAKRVPKFTPGEGLRKAVE